MNFGEMIEALIGALSTASLLTIGAGILIGYFFRSYIVKHPALRKIIEYFGNVSVANPRNQATTTSEK